MIYGTTRTRVNSDPFQRELTVVRLSLSLCHHCNNGGAAEVAGSTGPQWARRCHVHEHSEFLPSRRFLASILNSNSLCTLQDSAGSVRYI